MKIPAAVQKDHHVFETWFAMAKEEMNFDNYVQVANNICKRNLVSKHL